MQAIFLSSGRRSCGTGFFLPRTVGDDYQPRKKPGMNVLYILPRVLVEVNSIRFQVFLQKSVAHITAFALCTNFFFSTLDHWSKTAT